MVPQVSLLTPLNFPKDTCFYPKDSFEFPQYSNLYVFLHCCTFCLSHMHQHHCMKLLLELPQWVPCLPLSSYQIILIITSVKSFLKCAFLQTHRHRDQTCGCQGWVREGQTGSLGLADSTLLYIEWIAESLCCIPEANTMF